MQILIVEDDLGLSRALRHAFEGCGVAVDAVRTIADAMRRALRATYDLVILDLFVIDGATVSLSNFFRIRAPEMPILSITGTTVFAHGDHSEAMSADYLLRKPVSLQEVTDIAFYLMGKQTMLDPGAHADRQQATGASRA